MFFKRDTRMMNHLTKKRGFVTLEDYMKTFADANPAAFPPFRSVYIPDECELLLLRSLHASEADIDLGVPSSARLASDGASAVGRRCRRLDPAQGRRAR